MYDYPFIDCDEHPGPQWAVIVCDHVLSGDTLPALVCAPSDEDVGTLVCRECLFESVRTSKAPEAVRLICLRHLKQHVRALLIRSMGQTRN